MNLKETFKIAWEGINSNKVRALLTMLGIIIGVAAVIVMMAVSAGTEAVIEDQISGLGSNLIIVTNQGFGRGPGAGNSVPETLDYDDAIAIEQEISGIVGVAAEQIATSQVAKAGSVNIEVDVLGSMPGFPDVRGVSVGDGRFFTQDDLDRNAKVAVLGYQTAQDLFGDPSTSSGQDPIGQTVTVGNTKLTVIGVMDEKGLVGDTDYDQRIYVPLTVAFKHFSFSQRFGERVMAIYVAAESPETMDSAIIQIESLLNRRHEQTELDDAFFGVLTQDDIIETQEATTGAFRGWHRHHEHHAGQCHRAHARDRPAPGAGRRSGRHPLAIPHRGAGAQPGRRPHRHSGRRERLADIWSDERDAHSSGDRVHHPGLWFGSRSGYLFRILPGQQGGAVGPH